MKLDVVSRAAIGELHENVEPFGLACMTNERDLDLSNSGHRRILCHSDRRIGCSKVTIEGEIVGEASTMASLIPSSNATMRTDGGSGLVICEIRSPARIKGLRDRQTMASPRWLWRIMCNGTTDVGDQPSPITLSKLALKPSNAIRRTG